MANKEKQIVIYETSDKEVTLDVQFDGDSVWLTLDQMAELFDRDKSTISRHIKNVFGEQELDKDSVVAKIATTASDNKTYQVDHFNLDMIISVGYRVKSLRGTQFRQWANVVLRQYLLTGAAINQKRLEQLGTVVHILERSSDEMVSGVAEVLDRYTASLELLEEYDKKSLTAPKGSKPTWELRYEDARALIDAMPFDGGNGLFGVEKDESFKSALGAIYQTFGGEDLYSSVQEKAANLLYLVVKNHPFNDGNKRIAAALFVYFLSGNGILFDTDGRQIIANNALAAITLMIALSRPDEKEIMCLLVMNMLAGVGEDRGY